MTGPLNGIRIIEIANVVAGPSAAAQLADQGADVIKIEPPSGRHNTEVVKNGSAANVYIVQSWQTVFNPRFKKRRRPRNIMEVNRESRCVNSKPSTRRNGKTWF